MNAKDRIEFDEGHRSTEIEIANDEGVGGSRLVWCVTMRVMSDER